MVNQLKAQLDDSQIMISQSTIILPKLESKQDIPTTYNPEMPKEDLIQMLHSKDSQLEELKNRLQQSQANVLDLQENVKEKDSVIDARTKAITLLSENLSKKGKNTLDMLDETKEQMRSMQEQFVDLESKMKEENAKLQLELTTKNVEIENLIQSNKSLLEEKDLLNQNNVALEERLGVTISELDKYKLELSANEIKIQELTTMNEDFEQSLLELRKPDENSERSASSSPQRGGRQKSKNWKKSKQKSVSDLPPETEANLTRITDLEKLVEELKLENEKLQNLSREMEESSELESLKKQLETMNKNMIKAKAQYKSKLKELQKKATPGEINEKLIGLESENVKLEQRIAELEEEKGNLQLRLVDVDGNKGNFIITLF